MLAIDRSIPPPEMMKVMPQARTTVMAACLKMLKMLFAVKKVYVVRERTTPKIRISSVRLNSLLSSNHVNRLNFFFIIPVTPSQCRSTI